MEILLVERSYQYRCCHSRGKTNISVLVKLPLLTKRDHYNECHPLLSVLPLSAPRVPESPRHCLTTVPPRCWTWSVVTGRSPSVVTSTSSDVYHYDCHNIASCWTSTSRSQAATRAATQITTRVLLNYWTMGIIMLLPGFMTTSHGPSWESFCWARAGRWLVLPQTGTAIKPTSLRNGATSVTTDIPDWIPATEGTGISTQKMWSGFICGYICILCVYKDNDKTEAVTYEPNHFYLLCTKILTSMAWLLLTAKQAARHQQLWYWPGLPRIIHTQHSKDRVKNSDVGNELSRWCCCIPMPKDVKFICMIYSKPFQLDFMYVYNDVGQIQSVNLCHAVIIYVLKWLL